MNANELTAAQACAAIAAGKLTSEALVRACLARIGERDAEVKAWSYVDAGLALRQARELDKSPRRGPLHGVPVAIKDMIDTADMPTQHNSPIYVGHRPNQDAACVSLLRSAGAVILGKTDTHEFAAGGRLPATRNPHHLMHTPGGSSSGSAAAVADQQVPLALGTQTAGSTIRPASFCGVFAMKPTFGLLSREGAKLYSITLDTIGWFGRSVADLGLLADAFHVTREPWRARKSIKGARIALCRTPYWKQASRASQAAVETAAARLTKAGAKVSELALPKEFAGMNEAQATIMRSEGRAAFRPEYQRAHALLHQDFRDRVENADRFTVEQILAALDLAGRLRPVFDGIAKGYDALLCPSAIGEAPKDLKTTGDPLFQRMWTTLHVPCINVPGFSGPNGLPIGVQLVGARCADAALLGVADAAARVIQGD
jgi:Asp-tRNA(Asn)/Glu-tRNA(Gln) amidotransferase A subunit family amidase